MFTKGTRSFAVKDSPDDPPPPVPSPSSHSTHEVSATGAGDDFLSISASSQEHVLAKIQQRADSARGRALSRLRGKAVALGPYDGHVVGGVAAEAHGAGAFTGLEDEGAPHKGGHDLLQTYTYDEGTYGGLKDLYGTHCTRSAVVDKVGGPQWVLKGAQ